MKEQINVDLEQRLMTVEQGVADLVKQVAKLADDLKKLADFRVETNLRFVIQTAPTPAPPWTP